MVFLFLFMFEIVIVQESACGTYGIQIIGRYMWLIIFTIDMGKGVLTLPDEAKNVSLLINSLLPIKVYLHGTSIPFPNLLYPVTTHCRVSSSRTAECVRPFSSHSTDTWEGKKCNGNIHNICLILIQKLIGVCNLVSAHLMSSARFLGISV